MNDHEWVRQLEHPYQKNRKAKDTHGHLKPTNIQMPIYSTLVVPFWWMLRKNQPDIQAQLAYTLPNDEAAPFDTPWVFSPRLQEALLKHFFGQIEAGKSLVLFYAKQGHPFGDHVSRVVTGIGRIRHMSDVLHYQSNGGTPYPMWDRLIAHSIRLDGVEGFLIPYHDYLEPVSDAQEQATRLEQVREIVVGAPPDQIRTFSYAAELASADIALSTLLRCRDVVRVVAQHGVASGPWTERETWINDCISEVWSERGAFPGTGVVLQAMGLRLGTTLVLDLMRAGRLTPTENPWPLIDQVIRGEIKPPAPGYKGALESVRGTWQGLSDEKRDFVRLLSRFELTPDQAARWFDEAKRTGATEVAVLNADVLQNPFRISEVDLGTRNDYPVQVSSVDRALFPDSVVAAKHPVPAPSAMDSAMDPRRVRAALVAVLRNAAAEGDSLLSAYECLERLESLKLHPPCVVPTDWLHGNQAILRGVIEQFSVKVKQGDSTLEVPVLQLTEHFEREEKLRKFLQARAIKQLPPTKTDWASLLRQSIGPSFQAGNARHEAALTEQAHALRRITSRKLSALVGAAGTGKTSILGALLLEPAIEQEGVLFLAPTGKARVRLAAATGAPAKTIAQFLYSLKRYDGIRQRPLFEGSRYRKQKTVVIDETSMLTSDDLLAVLLALDLMHVERIILVGDPNQLPPIGVGRPFADFTGWAGAARDSENTADHPFAEALAELSIEVRSVAGAPSDTLRLATWFTHGIQPVDSDRVVNDISLGNPFNDLEIRFWTTYEELQTRLFEQLAKHLGLDNETDVAGFNKSLGFAADGSLSLENDTAAENWQILSPVRMHPHGVHELNRVIQQRYRQVELQRSRRGGFARLGNEEITWHDKVIQLRNQDRRARDWRTGQDVDEYLANGEVGLVRSSFNDFLALMFAGRPFLTFGYPKKHFGEEGGPLELAYALTVHKAQGSEFGIVFFVIPAEGRLLSRELLYTALTRSRQQTVLLVEGSDASYLYDLSRPEASETARRNTNLFGSAVREKSDRPIFADHLIHHAPDGVLVRSKSELVIAQELIHQRMDYFYERELQGTAVPGVVHPDFTVPDAAGDPILWEHLGLLNREEYRRGWEWKREWYRLNGFVENQNLFSTVDDERGGLDAREVRRVAELIKIRV